MNQNNLKESIDKAKESAIENAKKFKISDFDDNCSDKGTKEISNLNPDNLFNKEEEKYFPK